MTRPARWFAIAAALLLLLTPLISRVMAPAGDVDLSLHDSYFVFPPSLVCLAMAALLGLLAGAYSIFSLSPRAAKWHFWLTTASMAGFWLSFYIFGTHMGTRLSTQTLADSSTPAFEAAIAAVFILSSVVVILSPAILLVNVALEWARSRRLT